MQLPRVYDGTKKKVGALILAGFLVYSMLGCSFPSTNNGTNTPNPTYIKPVDNSVPITPSTTQSPDDPIYQKAMKLGYPDKTARKISMIWTSYPGDRTALGVLWDADPTATEKFAEDGKLTDLKQTFLKTLNRLDVSFTHNIQKDGQVSVEPFELTLTGIDTGFFNEYAGNITQDTNKLLEKAVNAICNSTVEPYTLAVYNLWEQVEKPSYKTPRIKVSEGLPSVSFPQNYEIMFGPDGVFNYRSDNVTLDGENYTYRNRKWYKGNGSVADQSTIDLLNKEATVMPLFVWLDPNGDGKPNAVLADRNGYIGGYYLNWYDEFYTYMDPISPFNESDTVYCTWGIDEKNEHKYQRYDNRWVLLIPEMGLSDLDNNPISPEWIQIIESNADTEFLHTGVSLVQTNHNEPPPFYDIIQRLKQENYWVLREPWSSDRINYNSDGLLSKINLDTSEYWDQAVNMDAIFKLMYSDTTSGNFFDANERYWLEVFDCNSWNSCGNSGSNAISSFGDPVDPLSQYGAVYDANSVEPILGVNDVPDEIKERLRVIGEQHCHCNSISALQQVSASNPRHHPHHNNWVCQNH